MRILAENLFRRQLTLWINYFVYASLGMFLIFLGWIGQEDKLSIWFSLFGFLVFFLSVVLINGLIYELYKPKEVTITGQLVKVSNTTPLRVGGYFGYSLIFSINGENRKLQLIHREKGIKYQLALNILLNKNETFRIKYLSQTKLITEIESISFPELNTIIEKCFIDKRVSKKDRKKAFKLLDEYSKR